MKVLLDECVTHDLRPLIVGHEVFTVVYMGWSGRKNGELLALARDAGFEVLITTDQAMPDQHNVSALPIAVCVVHAATGRIQDVQSFIDALLRLLASPLSPGFYAIEQL